MKPSRCQVLVPIFNNFSAALTCLHSLRRHTPTEVPVLLIDDASTEGDFLEFLVTNSFHLPEQWKLVRQPQNLGFTKTVNRGFAATSPDDVVLLNSDTVVTAGWIRKLQAAATSHPQIATVTPLTNNGTVCSVPAFGVENELPLGKSVDSFAELIESVSLREYPVIPTCVGFCVYIKREPLERAGYLDEKNFPRGYGEENDLSCRLTKIGYLHIIADDTFVFHEGGGSFSHERALRMREGEEAMRRLHPKYYPEVVRFFRVNPLRSVQERIHRRLIEEREQSGDGQKKRVLHILHNGPFAARRDPLGGTEYHVQSLIRHLPEFSHWSLIRARSGLLLEAHGQGVSSTYSLPYSDENLTHILNPGFFDLIHVHHTRWFELSHLRTALQHHGQYTVSLHDFVSLCPRFHLFTVRGEHCTGNECVSACGYRSGEIDRYREEGRKILLGAKEVFAFSENTLRYVSRVLRVERPVTIVQHGIDTALLKEDEPEDESLDPVVPPKEPGVLRVLTVAARAKHKGEALMRELFRHTELPGGERVEWVVLGEWSKEEASSELLAGSFVRSELRRKVKALQPDVGMLLSLVPETYGLMFDELLQCGLPLVVGPLGAPAERIRAWGAGWRVDELTSGAILSLLSQLAVNPGEVQRVTTLAERAPLRSEADEAAEFGMCYRDYSRGESSVSLQDFLKPCTFGEPLPTPLRRTVQRVLDATKVIIERLRLRALVLPLMQRVFGEKLSRRLKGF